MPTSVGGGAASPGALEAAVADLEAAIAALESGALARKSTTVLYECSYPAVVVVGDAATPNVYGAYVEITAGLGYDVEVYGVVVTPTTDAVVHGAVELAKGAAAAEVPVASFAFYRDYDSTAGKDTSIAFTLPTPILVTNQRIAARMKSTAVSQVCRVFLLWRKVS